jgi:SAM-dependent methyltransferase
MSEGPILEPPDPARFRTDRVRNIPDTPGILSASGAPFVLSPAQRVNLTPPTAWGYEPVWRHRSIGILTGGSFSTERELAVLRDWTGVQDSDCVLDAGCSSGLYARTLKRAAPGAEVHAVDVSLPFLREAQRYAHREDMRLQLVRADVEALPYRDGAFDVVASGGSLNEFRSPGDALRELSRVLRPGGRLFLMYTARSQRRGGQLAQDVLTRSGLSFPTPAAVDAWAAAAGMAAVRSELHRPIGLALYRKRVTTGAQTDPR